MSKADQPSLIPDSDALPALLKKRDDPRLEQLAGRKELRVLQEILARLSGQAGHGNRILESHHVLLLHLLGFYNPMMRSLRTFELASQNQHVQEVVGLERVCRSTHSDFLAVVDPEILEPVVQALRKKVPAAGNCRTPLPGGAVSVTHAPSFNPLRGMGPRRTDTTPLSYRLP